MNKKTVKLIIRGKVQRVGYRAFVYAQVADNLPMLVGYVKNLGNGDVEIMASGDAHDLNQMVKYAYLGSKLSKVESIEVLEISSSEIENYENFIILR